jgi:diguanylate cyclase (GGDEF)-like protein
MDERLTAEVAGATRSGRPLSLVMLDLDHFKHLNDAFGHPFGDLVLQRVGDLLARSVRPCDVACRYGGEELAVILTDTTIVGAHAVAERIRNEIRTLDLAPRRRAARQRSRRGRRWSSLRCKTRRPRLCAAASWRRARHALPAPRDAVPAA